MRNLVNTAVLVFIAVCNFTNLTAQTNTKSGIQTSSNHMPNRISMNVTVARQTIQVAIIDGGCVILMPNKKAYRINTSSQSMTEVSEADFNQKISATQRGGALPGGSIISAAVSSISTLAGNSGGGAAAASYARTSGSTWTIRDTENQFQLPSNITDGEYELTFKIVEKATSGLKDTLKTQVRLGFTIENGILKTKHDTVKNSISNIR